MTPKNRYVMNLGMILLKGPKCEIFGFEFFALIRPIWIGDLGTRP